MVTAWLTLAAAAALGYGLRMVRPMRALFDWAETQFEGDGWDRWWRRIPAFVILSAALALHPAKTRAAYRANRERGREQTAEFNGAMRAAVKIDPDWADTEEPTP